MNPYARQVGAGTTFLSPTDFYVEVDTSVGAVTIVLPSILTIMEIVGKLGITFAGIRILDVSNNASVNNITIVAGGSDRINDITSIVLNTNGVGGIFNTLSGSEWAFNQNNTGVENPVILLGAGTGSSYRCGNSNTASGQYSTVSGGYSNISSSGFSTVSGGTSNAAYGFASVISGGASNTASGCYSTIGGSRANTSSGNYSFVGGGAFNIASGYISTVSGGRQNTASCYFSIVSGGFCNTASAYYSTVGGGICNTASSSYSTVGGGYINTALGDFSTISGGYCNISLGNSSTVSGGCCNTASGSRSTVSGGQCNTASGCYSAILGGKSNTASGLYSGAFGCNLNASCNCTFYTNNHCACGSFFTSSIPASCAVCVNLSSELVGYTSTNYPRDYGSFYDITDQTTLGNTEEIMKYGNTDLSNGITIVNDGLGNPTKITVSNTGVYNIQFSAQLTKSGGMLADTFIYLKKNGNQVPDSNTQVTLANNGHYLVASWNFLLQLNAGEYAQIAWYATSNNVSIDHVVNGLGLPDIPSVILTVCQL